MQTALAKAGAVGLVIGARLGTIDGEDGPIIVDHTSLTMPLVMFDAVYVAGGEAAAQTLATSGLTLSNIAEAYKDLKALALGEDAAALLLPKAGIEVREAIAADFIVAIGQHRIWARKNLEPVPA